MEQNINSTTIEGFISGTNDYIKHSSFSENARILQEEFESVHLKACVTLDRNLILGVENAFISYLKLVRRHSSNYE